MESFTEQLSRHRAVRQLGLVGRYRVVVEDARRSDRGWAELFVEHWTVLGFGHRWLLSESRAYRRALCAVVPVRVVHAVLPWPWAYVVAPSAVGLGPERH